MTATNEFYDRISSLIQQARQRFKTAVNLAMVYTYYEIGMNIVEEEQKGQPRAVYGTSLLKGLSEYLTDHLEPSYSEDNLKLMRRFYLVYSDDEIGETLFPQFANQSMTAMNYYDRKVKLPDENKTIGIVLCKDKNNEIVEMTLPENNKNIFASQYLTYLPSKEQLKSLLQMK